MSNIEILIMIALFAIFLSGCVTENTIFVDKIDNKVAQFFDKSQSLNEFMVALYHAGFAYTNSMNDINYYVDTPSKLEDIYDRMSGNCLDSAAFIKAFLKYKGCYDNIKVVALRQRGFAGIVVKWHYILIVKVGDALYETSNSQIRTIDNIEQSQLTWAAAGYAEFEVIENINK